jgi:CHRD domain/Secretion system C-terminal sorting domain/Calx-beta domain
MKPISTFLKQIKIANLLLISFAIFAFSSVINGQTTATEDFENETAANSGVVFSEGGINFTTTFPLKDFPLPFPSGSYGYGASAKYLEIARVGMIQTTTATISLNTAINPGIGFKINSFAAYTAANNGGTIPNDGIVTVSGTPVGGGAVVSANISVLSVSAGMPPRETNGMVNGLNLSGTALDGLFFTSLTFSIFDTNLGTLDGTSYLALDHINFTTQAPVTNNYAIGPASITEGNGGTSILSYQVNRSSGTAVGSVQIQSSNVTATAGSDYVALPLTTVNFPIGSTTQTVNVTINGDTGIEPNETFNMTLSSPTGGTIATGTGVVTITDDDEFIEIFDDDVNNANTFSQNGITFSSASFPGDKLVVKNGGAFGAGGSSGYSAPFEDATHPYTTGNQGSFKITSSGKSFYMSKIDLWSATVSGGPTPNWTFTPTNCTVTFTGTKFDGTGTVTHTAAITPTQTNNPPRDVYTTVNFAGTPLANVQLSAISFSVPSPITYLQIDNFKYGVSESTATQVSINDVSVLEGTGGGASNVATFTVSRTNNTTSFTVDVNSSAGTAAEGFDYTAFPSTILNFTAGGGLSQTVSVPVLKDGSIESNETFNMNLFNATNGTLYLKQVGVGTILDDDKICETFDNEVNNATAFSENSIAFSSNNRFKVSNSGNPNGLGSGNSPGFLIGTNGAVGSFGKIILTPTDKAFKISSVDAWVSTDGTNGTSGSVKFIGTLFGGGGFVETTKAVAPNSVGGWNQNILFTGTPLDNVLLTELEVISLTPITEVDIDNFCYAIFNTAPIIELADAGNVPITNGGAASATNDTDFGAACVTGGTVSKTYTIKNTGAVNLTLPNPPNSLILGGADASHFSISSYSGTAITPGGFSTFTVLFNPTSAGEKNATLTINSNDPTNSPFVINIKGTGNANPDATITANNFVCQLATLNLSAPAGASTYVWSGEGIVLANVNSTTAVPFSISSQTYSVVVTSAANCTSTGTKVVTINAKPNLVGPADQTICKGTSTYILGQCVYNVYTTINAANEVPTNNSTATGIAYGTFNTLTNQLSLTVTFTGLSNNATAGHIHGAAPVGMNAGVLVGFTVPSTTSGSFSYNQALNATNAAHLLAGNTYINIHSGNFPNGEIRGQLTASCTADVFTWNPGNISGIGTTVTPTNLGANTYTLTATNSTTGCSNTTSVNINVDNVTLPTAATVNTQIVGNVPLVSNGCEYVAKVVPTAGFTTATVKSWVETIPPYVYVPRHFEITPSTDPTNATGTVTLYFSQADFDTYNGTITSSFLPINPTDAAGIANFQILKYAGTSPTGTGYMGAPVYIPGPGNAWNTGLYTFVWNADNSIWEVTFPVTGFSGFLAKSVAQPLPINLISFSGKKTGENENTLTWKTDNEKNFSHFEIQRSENGKVFEKIGKVEGNHAEFYQFLDLNSSLIDYNSSLFYRLKMIDLDGSSSFSKIISIENDFEKSIVGKIYPNPTKGNSDIEINVIDSGNWQITLFDLTGKIISTESKFLTKGNNLVSIQKLQQGVNFVRFENGIISEIRKVLKQ